MKDEKGHGSDPHGGAAHQVGVDNATRQASYWADRATQNQLEAESSRTGQIVNSFPRGPMGLTPDHIRATPEYQSAKAASERAFQAYRNFNGMMVKKYPDLLKAERAVKRQARMK